MDLKVNATERRAGILRKLLLNPITGALLCLVDISKADANTGYQRKLSQSHVSRIKSDEHFEHRAARNPVLSFRNGKLWVPDGQHTIEALVKRGTNEAICDVHYGLTYEDEARLFHILNDSRRRPNNWTSFKAAFQGNCPVERRIIEIVEEVGLTTPIHVDYREAELRSTHLLRSLLDRSHKGNYKHAVRFCTILKRTYPTSKTDRRVQEAARKLEFLRGLNLFLIANQSIDTDVIVRKLSKKSAGAVIDLSLVIAGKSSKARADARQISEALHEVCGLPVSASIKRTARLRLVAKAA